ncbi:hypothetical protein pipiens_018929 [Culex pipiens pipiens]|uniref:Uncharacterized protein n=1 Tax=Culex pipiens pipiens TaxID=38569 RepID=A0ABD1DXC7_CULPP
MQQNFQGNSMKEIKQRLLTDDYGKHVIGVANLLRRHEQQLTSWFPRGTSVPIVSTSDSRRSYLCGTTCMTSTFPVASDFFQLFADADDIDNWMLGAMRLMSSEDVGRDGANVQSLLKDQKVQERLAAIDARYKELVELIKLRKQRLLDALSLYKLISESDGVERASACRPVAI